jgi:hypothetical protein
MIKLTSIIDLPIYVRSMTSIISRAKSKWNNPKNVKKLALNSQLPTVQILTNDVQLLILCLSYFITTVSSIPSNVQIFS